jgi:hypothetical protein
VIGLLQTAWALAFIARSSFVVEGQRYFCLFDDAMVSMRYAANWANGLGLVWNPGERVEGYTNFLWTMMMGVVHLLPLSHTHACLVVQLMGILALLSCLCATVRLAQSCRLLSPVAIIAVLLTAGYYSLSYYTLLGMETGPATCAVTLALAAAVRSLHDRQGRLTTLLWFAPALLLRPDVMVLFFFVLGFLLVEVPAGRLQLLGGAAIVGAAVGLHLLWRHSFYGEWVPNTYFLKMTNWPLSRRLAAGCWSGLWVCAQLWLPWLLALAALKERRSAYTLLGGCVIVSWLYHVYVGGDAWSMSRYIIPTAPALFLLAAVGARRVSAGISGSVRSRTLVRHGAAGLSLAAINALVLTSSLLIDPPEAAAENRNNIRLLRAIDRIAPENATIAVGYAGTIPYYSGLKSFDMFGKCDPVIARMPAIAGIDRPGHNKRDLDYVAREQKPDIVLHGMDPHSEVFTSNYRPVTVEVDGVVVGFCLRRGCLLRTAREVKWNVLYQLLTQ